MYRLSHFYFMLCYLFIISEHNFVQSVCTGSYVVFCESIDDLKHESSENEESWKEVTVGTNAKIPHHALTEYDFYPTDVKRWTFINQFNEFDAYFYVPSTVKSLIFYGNYLKNISMNIRAHQKLDVLSFTHNNIEDMYMIPFADSFSPFYTDEKRGPDDYLDNNMIIWIDTIDLSFNKLKYTNSGKFFKNAIANELSLSHNELWMIGPNCLPRGLKRLRLDYNEFVYFSTLNLNSHNLSKLEYLSVAHNKLQAVDDLPALDALKHLDLSFNNLFQIPNVFGSFKKLRALNMEYNNLISFLFTNLLKKKDDMYHINLAFNRLRNLDVRPIKNSRIRLLLFGNPWNCECMDKLTSEVRNMTKYYVTVETSGCFPDRIPYCVINQFYGEPCSNEQISEDTFNSFRNTTRQIMTWHRKDQCFDNNKIFDY